MMYRYLAQRFAPPSKLFLVHPLQLSRFLETAWTAATAVPVLGQDVTRTPELGSATVIADFAMPLNLLQSDFDPGIDPADPDSFKPTVVQQPPDPTLPPLLWDHLIYAYLIESTGIYEIIAAILARIVRGETLGKLRPETLQWARATEELLFRDPPLFSVAGIESKIRPDLRVARRNAYWRMFGLDLPHPPPAAASAGAQPPWKVDVGAGANVSFVARWNELLTQIWTGYENRVNQVGANATDAEYVALLCLTLDDMLGNRRQGGLLAREELSFVAAMSWCHLTVETDTPLVEDLQATATNPAERLAKLGERVGMAPAPRSRELFELSEPMSALLWGIELGRFNPGQAPESLYLPDAVNGPPTKLNIEVNRIIDLWQSATGTRIKVSGATSPGLAANRPPAQPLRTPAPTLATMTTPAAAPAVASSNGARS
ncbi:MAG: hypothetical protein ABW022_23710 [Actinoplanes sp.]